MRVQSKSPYTLLSLVGFRKFDNEPMTFYSTTMFPSSCKSELKSQIMLPENLIRPGPF